MKSEKIRRWGASVPAAEEQFAIKRRVLIREAGKAFRKDGFHNTSLDDVARALGVSKTALYRYVTDKNEILYECHNMALEAGEIILAKAQADHESCVEVIRAFVLEYVSFLNSNLGSYAVLAEPLTSLRDRERKVLSARRRKFDAAMRDIVGKAIQAGEIADKDPALIVAFFMGTINSLSRWFDPSGKISGDEVARVYAELTVSALVGPARRPGPSSKS